MVVPIPLASLSPCYRWLGSSSFGWSSCSHPLSGFHPHYYFLPWSWPCSRVPGTVVFYPVSRYLILPSLTYPSTLLSRNTNLITSLCILKPFSSPNIKAWTSMLWSRPWHQRWMVPRACLCLEQTSLLLLHLGRICFIFNTQTQGHHFHEAFLADDLEKGVHFILHCTDPHYILCFHKQTLRSWRGKAYFPST